MSRGICFMNETTFNRLWSRAARKNCSQVILHHLDISRITAWRYRMGLQSPREETLQKLREMVK